MRSDIVASTIYWAFRRMESNHDKNSTLLTPHSIQVAVTALALSNVIFTVLLPLMLPLRVT